MKKKVTVAEARQAMRDAFKADPDYRQSWVANIACCIRDESGDLPICHEICNRIADRVVHMIED
jgi:hypothetical protein